MQKRSNPLRLLAFSLITIGLITRTAGLYFISLDIRQFTMAWYEELITHGFHALATDFSNYTPPYLYLLWLAGLMRDFLPNILGIKLIPVLFDFGNAFWMYKLLRLKYSETTLPLLGAAIIFVLPTVILDGAWWGQVDALHTFFVLGCLYSLLQERPVVALTFFGLAFAFKLQSIFFMPFLFLLFLKRRIPWYAFLVVPLMYGFAVLPAVMAGRPWWDALTIYFGQMDDVHFHALTLNAPNVYMFFPDAWYKPFLYPSLVVAGLVALGWSIGYARRIEKLTPEIMVMCAAASAVFMPFLLPKMHERYFYLGDVMLLVLAFYLPRLWYLPALAQVASVLTYSAFLFIPPTAMAPRLVLDPALTIPAALVNTFLVAVLAWQQFRLVRASAP
jgi:Gpi18-like mannosyltransferase